MKRVSGDVLVCLLCCSRGGWRTCVCVCVEPSGYGLSGQLVVCVSLRGSVLQKKKVAFLLGKQESWRWLTAAETLRQPF